MNTGRAHLRQQFCLGPQSAHGGAGGDEEHLVADLLNFVGHDFAFGALRVVKENVEWRFRAVAAEAAGPDNPVRPSESLPASDSDRRSSPAPAREDRDEPGAASAACANPRSRLRSVEDNQVRTRAAAHRSRASQPLPAVSSCQPVFTADPRQVQVDRSLLTSKIWADVPLFSAKGRIPYSM